MKTRVLCFLIACCLVDPTPAAETVLADFEADDYGGWSADGKAFGAAPARGTLPNQQPVTGFLGRGLVNSYLGGDVSQGTLTSPPFAISERYLNFLIGGGYHPGLTCINLLVDGTAVRSASGHNAEQLAWHTWDLGGFLGKTGRLEIVDRHSGGWGHINIDHVVLSGEPRVKSHANDAITRAMASVETAAQRAKGDATRPVYHFRAPANWINDPNGPIYHDGYYHMFYQHNPYGDDWGHMHWGHARSSDLVRWEHLPIALWPSKEAGEDHCFSGCATLDGNGRPMIFYTSIGRGKSATDHAEQWAALSDDKLMTWKKHPANPVLSEQLHGETKIYDWRDPFVFKHEGADYMVLGGNLNRGRGGQAVVALYQAANPDLTDWKYRGVLFTHPDPKVGNIECPLFFKLNNRWVLIVSPHRAVEYFVGDFDAEAGRFVAEHQGMLDWSGDFYAPNCLEDGEGRRILWGWVRGFKKGLGWNGCLTLPRVLRVDAHGRLIQTPAVELEQLRGTPLPRRGGESAADALQRITGDALEIRAQFVPGEGTLGLNVRVSGDGGSRVPVRFDGKHLEVAGVKAALELGPAENLELTLFLDKSVIEVLANGRVSITRVLSSAPADLGIEVVAGGGNLQNVDAWPMKRIWRD